MARILIVEDDPETAQAIVATLQGEGHDTAHAEDGRRGLVLAAAGDFDVIVLDRMLPGLDGLGLLTALRAAGVQTPVLFLSALSDLDERVRGLRAGGDDYLTKPFESIELVARSEALLRRRARPRDSAQTRLSVGDLDMDLIKRVVTRGGRKLELVPREYELLLYLVQHADRVVTRTMLFEAVWKYRYDERTNVIEVHIGRLRKKVDAEGDPPLIHTVRGAGYVLKTPE
ncbi:MAG: response regulator transcription factor [Variovorax sp.]|nr:response regulator transcription factor [Variovorax sp.]